MKRDMDLVRSILLALENSPHGRAPTELVVEGYSDEQVGYHAHLMHEAGLIVAADATSLSSPSPCAMPLQMTWYGHDFLDAARSVSIWERAKDLTSQVGSVSFEVLQDVLVAVAKEQLQQMLTRL